MPVLPIMEKLLQDNSSVTMREHVIESASRHVTNLMERFDQQFDSIVSELSVTWNQPQFNFRASDAVENERVIFPSWSSGKGVNGGKTHAERLCLWKTESGSQYVMIRAEADPKDETKLIYFSIVLGVKKRNVVRLSIDKSKQNPNTLTTFASWFTKLFR